MVPHDFSAIYQMLCGAVAAGDLRHRFENSWFRVGNDASSLVELHALEEYARSASSLFDTLMPGQEELAKLRIRRRNRGCESIAQQKPASAKTLGSISTMA